MKTEFAALAAFVPMLESSTFVAGRWAGGDTVAENTVTFPYFEWGSEMRAVLAACYPLMLKGFSWPDWIHTEDADRVQADISAASEEDIRKLLTAMIRQERFCEGVLASAFQSGIFLAISRRAAVLAS